MDARAKRAGGRERDKVRINTYEIARSLLTDDVAHQIRKLQVYYLGELVKLLNTDSTLRQHASENTQVSKFVCEISSALNDIVTSRMLSVNKKD